MFEVQDLAVASPATVSRCGMVYMEPIHLGWEPIIDTWAYFFKEKERDKEKGTVPNHVNNLVEKIRNVFRENFKFLREECREVIASVDSNLVKSCLNLAQVMYEDFKTYCSELENPPTSNTELDNYMTQIMFFSFIWSAGANLQDNPRENSRAKFSQVIKSKMMKHVYLEGDVYDYYPDYSRKEFKLWGEMDKLKDWKYDRSVPYFNILVPTADTAKFRFMLEKLVRSGHNILFNGETGTGKSVIVQEYLLTLNQDHYSFSTMNFSAQTSSKNLLDLFMDKDKFIKKKRDLIGPPAGKRMVIFIDDINMPQPEKYGAQPPIELLRQIIDHGG
jgi:dynein heavy chain, axonemal